jgi:hypothetical protein
LNFYDKHLEIYELLLIELNGAYILAAFCSSIGAKILNLITKSSG